MLFSNLSGISFLARIILVLYEVRLQKSAQDVNKVCLSTVPVNTDLNNKRLFPELFFPQREQFDNTHIFSYCRKGLKYITSCVLSS